jgi:hypothetical protein
VDGITEWSLKDLLEARERYLYNLRQDTLALSQIRQEICRRGKTRRQLLAEGVPWVGY